MPILTLLIVLCLSLASPVAMAGQVDPLWLRAQEAMRASRDLVASEVSSETVVTDGSGKTLDTIKKSTRLSGWRDREPVRSTVSKVESQGSGLGEVNLEKGILDHPEQALADGDSVVRSGPAVLDGKTYVLFQVAGKQGKRPFTSRVWIDEAAGLPVRADYAIEGAPMAKSMSYSVLFGRDENARWMPVTVNIDAVLAPLFYKFQVRSVQNLSNWVKRP